MVGSRVLEMARRWFEPSIVSSVFEPLVADWQREWIDSPPSRRWWVSVRAWSAFACTVAISMPQIIFTPIPPAMSRRIALRITLFCAAIAAALSVPMVRSLQYPEAEAPLWAAILLMAVPAALTIAFPFAMLTAVDAIRRDGVDPRVTRAAALKLAAMAMAIMIAAGSYFAPLARRTFTELATPAGWNVPAPRFQQLSTVALLRHPERHTAVVPGRYTRAGEIRRELVNRAIAAVMPAVLIWLRWSALSHPRRRRYWPLPGLAMTVIVVAAFVASVFSGSMLEYVWGLPPGTGLLAPLAVFTAWSLVQQWTAPRESRDGGAAQGA